MFYINRKTANAAAAAWVEEYGRTYYVHLSDELSGYTVSDQDQLDDLADWPRDCVRFSPDGEVTVITDGDVLVTSSPQGNPT